MSTEGERNMKQIILDVREPNEFLAENIEGSINLPLSDLKANGADTLKNIDDQEVIIMCRSGMRAQLALNELKKYDELKHNFSIYHGGILAWKARGKPTLTYKKKIVPFEINRQVHLVAFLILITGLIGQNFLPVLRFLPYLVAFGLFLDATTGFCPMRLILKQLPWNNKRS